jgi:predicted secreted protein
MRSSRRVLWIGLALAGIAFFLPSCSPETVLVTLSDAGAVKTVHLGGRLVVQLAGSPSTGYTWNRVAPSDEDLATSPLEAAREGEWEFPGGESGPGASGLCIFEYVATRLGTVTLEYVYARAWEIEPVQTVGVTIWAQR